MSESYSVPHSFARTPFYQEFTVVFNDESLGLEVQKVHNAPVVRRLIRQNPIWAGAAEKGGVTVGSLVVAVANIQTYSLPYDDVLKKIKGSSRPFEITFRRLHAISDCCDSLGRLWQGFLSSWIGHDNGHWTGLYFLLCANGEFQAYAGTDPDSMSNKVDVLRISNCSVMWGKQAKERASEFGLVMGGMTAQYWEEIFLLQPENIDDQPMLFRASSAESRAEWVGAFATLEVSFSAPSSSTTESNLLQNKQRLDTKKSIDPLAFWPSLNVLKYSQCEKGEKSLFSSDHTVMGNLLSTAPKWKPICLVLLPVTGLHGGKNNEIDTIAKLCWYWRPPSDSSELPLGQVLLWGVKCSNFSEERGRTESMTSSSSSSSSSSLSSSFDADVKKVSANAIPSIPSASSSHETVVSSDGFQLDSDATGFILHAANRVLRLRFENASECQDWVNAIIAASDKASSSFCGDEEDHETSFQNNEVFVTSAKTFESFQSKLTTYQQYPDKVLKQSRDVFILLANGVEKHNQMKAVFSNSKNMSSLRARDISLSTSILRKDFKVIAGQYLLPLCDAYTVDMVFDILTDHCRQSSSSKQKATQLSSPSKSSSIALQAGKLLGDLATTYGGGDKRKYHSQGDGDRVMRFISATPLDAGISLPYKSLKHYCEALESVSRPDHQWENLRMKIGLESSEVLIYVYERVTMSGEEHSSSNNSDSFSASHGIDATVSTQTESNGSRGGGHGDHRNKEGQEEEHRHNLQWSEIGSLYLTDRHLVFLRKARHTSYRGFETTSGSRPIARIIPISQIGELLDRSPVGQSLLLLNSFLLTAHLDEQTVTEETISISLNFASCATLRSVFANSDFSLADELRAVGGGKTRALHRIMKESLQELIAAHQVSFHASTANLLKYKCCLKTVDGRHRGVGAMFETLRTAWFLGPKEVWSRGCGAELTKDELWSVEIRSHAITMWAALNLRRRSALTRCIGHSISSLLIFTRYLDNKNSDRYRKAHFSVSNFLKDLSHWNKICQMSTNQRVNSLIDDDAEENNMMICKDWLASVAVWLTHREMREQKASVPLDVVKLLHGNPSFETGTREEALKLRTAYSDAFNPSSFRDEWQLFMSFLDPLVDNFVDVLPGTQMHDLLHWKDPLLSLAVMTLFLAIAYHDLVYLFPTFCFLGYAYCLLISGSTRAAIAAEEVILNQLRKESTEVAPTLSTPESLEPPLTRSIPLTSDSQTVSKTIPKHRKSFLSPNTASSSTTTPNIAITTSGQARIDVDELDEEQMLAIAAAAAARRLSSNSTNQNAAVVVKNQQKAANDILLSRITQERSADLLGAHTPPCSPRKPTTSDTSPKHATIKAIPTSDEIMDSMNGSCSNLEEEEDSDGRGDGDSEDDKINEIEEEEEEEGNSTEVPTAPSLPNPSQEGVEATESYVEFMRQMRAHLGRMQLHLHRYNKYYLRWRSLQHWIDIPSSQILLCGLCFGAAWLAIVPHNYTFALGTVYAFARPIRKPLVSKNKLALSDAMIFQWLDGIPLEAPTHRSTSVAVQMALERSKKRNK